MKMFADFSSEKNKNFDHVQLSFSCLYFVSGNPSWFCRIWRKNWLDCIGTSQKEFGQSYGRNKFEAYRLAFKDLNQRK